MATKFCPRCSTDKPISEWGTNRSKPDGLASHCKTCRRSIANGWYADHRELHMGRAAAVTARARERFYDFIVEYLLDHPCVDCGEPDPIVLEFDHRDPATKLFNIGITTNRSLEAVKAEVAKCDVRCANCHRRRTGEQRGWVGKIEALARREKSTTCVA